jgi:predicted metal-dependent hydrolase
MQSKTDPELGKIEFIQSERAKNINVRILKDSLRVTLPKRATETDAMRFINSVRERIIRKQEKLKTDARSTNLLLRENSTLQTLTFAVEIRRAEKENVHFSMKNAVLTIEFPQKADCEDEKMQTVFWNGINYFLKKEAKRVLPERVRKLADTSTGSATENGFSYSQVKIQSSKSRWGSCSRGKNINLSFYLMLLPQHLVDYVILHELCHTKEMNHSPKFWQWMDKTTDGKAKNLRTEMKKYKMPDF